MHFDQNVILVIVAAIVGISRLVARLAENSREQSRRRNSPSQPIQRTSPPAVSTPRTDEQRVREFLEALGAPAGTFPPPKVQPRIDVPPRPVAPVAPPPIARPFSPVILKPMAETARRIFTPRSVPVPPETIAPAARDRSGEWLRDEKQVSETAAKFQDATRASEIGPQTMGSTWRDALRSRESIRTALVLREILGPPSALRELG